MLQEEVADILSRRKAEITPGDDKAEAAYDEAAVRYQKAYKVAMQWTKNYTEFNFRSLGSYTHAEFDRIAEAPDAF